VRPPASLFPLLALLAVVGCGKEESAGRDGATKPLSAGETLKVTGREYSFAPAAVVLNGGGALRIRLRNEGSLAHNLRLRRDGDEVGGTPVLTAGRSGSATVTVRPGRYEMICTVGDHAELGMTGELQVKE
jgi:plastocyanin